MLDKMIKDLEVAENTIFFICNNSFRFSKNFDVAELVEHDSYFTINELEFDITEDIERVEDDECIEYIFKYNDSSVTISITK